MATMKLECVTEVIIKRNVNKPEYATDGNIKMQRSQRDSGHLIRLAQSSSRREAPNCKDTKIVASNADSNEAANADSNDPLLLLDDSGSGKKDRASFQLPDNTVLPQCILS